MVGAAEGGKTCRKKPRRSKAVPGKRQVSVAGGDLDTALPCVLIPEVVETVVYQDTISIRTSGHRDMHDITDQVTRIVQASGIRTGVAHVFNIGSTGAIGTIEF